MKNLLKHIMESIELGTLCKYCEKDYVKFEDMYNRCIPINKDGSYHNCIEKKEAKKRTKK